MVTPTPRPVTIGVSLKTYFGHAQARDWFTAVADSIRSVPAIVDGSVSLFIVPTYLQLHAARAAFDATPVRIGAQDVSQYGPGPYTGEISAAELAEIGVTITEIGHAERRRLFGEDSELVARKATAALNHGIEPLLCVGETHRTEPSDAAATTVAQLAADLRGAPAGAVIVAYEPVWAIGAPEPAPADHITAVTRALRAALLADPARAGSAVIYGGSAGPGLLARLGDAVDGLFLGRFAHDVDSLRTVLDEASLLARTRTRTEAHS